MRSACRAGAASLAAALALAGCGGGANSAPGVQPVTAAAHATPPAASSRTSIATANLTLVFPPVLIGKAGQIVRAAPSSSSRHQQFVDPGTSNLIDIYVDGSLIPNIDGLAGANDSIVVTATPEGTQGVSLPLYATGTNWVVAVEYDSSHSNLLALGEANLINILLGTVNTVSMTMQMNVTGVGLIDLPGQTDPLLMSGQTLNIGVLAPCGLSSQFATYPTDANGTFVPVSGYGGTSTPSVTGAGVGITSLSQPQTQFVPSFTISWDLNCDDMVLTAIAANPANAIWNDVTGGNSGNYSNAYYGGSDRGGPNQGVWDLYNVYGALGLFSQTSTASVTKTIDIY